MGGGFHISPDIGDLSQLPSVPTVNLRVTRWLSDRWGVTGNVIAGVGSGGRELDRSVHEARPPSADPAYRDPAYLQFLVRYRMRMRRFSGAEAGRLYFGIGGGAIGVRERSSRLGDEVTWTRSWGRHFLNVEVLGSWVLTDRFSLRAGVGAVPPFLVHPAALLAWRF